MVRVVLRHQPLTLLVAVGTLALTVYLYIIVPEGLLPGAGYGRDPGHLAGAGNHFVPRHGRAPAGTGEGHSAGSGGGESHFVHRRGRHQHDHEQRPHSDHAEASRGARRSPPSTSSAGCSRSWRRFPASRSIMQPVQDLTVEDRISRTQYQYALDAPDKAILDRVGPAALSTKLKQIPELRDVASDQQNSGLGLEVDIDRDTAGRLGITPQNVDDALYDAFGQRQVSTIFTQSNQYHVILEAAPQWQQSADALQGSAHSDRLGIGEPGVHGRAGRHQHGADRRGIAAAGSAQLVHDASARVPIPITINHQGQFPVVTLSFNLAPGASLGAAVDHIRKATKELGMPASIEPTFQGTAHAFENVARQRADADSGGDRHRLHRAGRAVRKLHPPDHDSFHAALGRRGRDRWR